MTIELEDFHETDFIADKNNQNNGRPWLRWSLQLSKIHETVGHRGFPNITLIHRVVISIAYNYYLITVYEHIKHPLEIMWICILLPDQVHG